MLQLLQQKKNLQTTSSTIWENIYGCDEQYRYATALYLLLMLYHAHEIIIDIGVEAPGHGKDVVDGTNATYKRYLSMLMTTVQLPDAPTKKSKMLVHTSIENTDIILERELKKTFQVHHMYMA